MLDYFNVDEQVRGELECADWTRSKLLQQHESECARAPRLRWCLTMLLWELYNSVSIDITSTEPAQLLQRRARASGKRIKKLPVFVLGGLFS